MTIDVTRPHRHIRLTKAKLDLTVWQEFLDNFNGRAFFLTDRFHTDGCFDIYTDASGSVDYGAVYGKKWFWRKWPSAWFTRNIAVLELFPIMAAVVVCGSTWANQNFRFVTDNEALVSVINKQTSRDPHIMTLLRRMILTCLTFNINFMASRLNSLADSLSRGQLDAFRMLAPWADSRPNNLSYHCLPQQLLLGKHTPYFTGLVEYCYTTCHGQVRQL